MTAREPIPQVATMKAHALGYAQRGWHVFPVFEVVEKEGAWVCSCSEGEQCPRPGKHPRTRDGLKEATTDPVTIEKWWMRWSNASIGIATGRASNLTVVDADASEGKPGVVNITRLSSANGGMPATLIADTGGGGLHIYFLFTERLPTGANIIDEAIDVRSEGGYVIAPPSRHVSGRLYAWRNEGRGDLITVPDWLASARRTVSEEAERRRGRKRTQPGFKLDKLESMLGALDPDDRDLWLQVGVIMGRLYLGTGMEADAWAVYETWSARSAKFDEDRAGNLARMRDMFYERSQAAPRTGGKPLGVGTIISAAKAAGWSPFGDRVRVPYEPGNEADMAEKIAEALAEYQGNTIFNSMGVVVDVLHAASSIPAVIHHAKRNGQQVPEITAVRVTSTATLLCEASRCAVLETTTKDGVPEAKAIEEKLGRMILEKGAGTLPTLAGIATWPMVGESGELIAKDRGYDPETCFYFCIDPSLRKLNETISAEAATDWLLTELLGEFPFEDETDRAAALGMLIAFMQRPLMRTCPGYAVVAPQPGSGKSTLVEIASQVVHGERIAAHPLSQDEDELRKAVHSLLLAKYPAVLFDNVGRGSTVDSDHLAKLLTAEAAADRTLGSSETRKFVNSLLVTFTGNNIQFARDMASRVVTVRLNAKTAQPLARKFRHDIKKWVLGQRHTTLSALVAVARAGLRFRYPEGSNPSRFEDFDELVAKPVMAVTGVDLRAKLTESAEAESDEDADQRAALTLLSRWQQSWRKAENGSSWRTRDLIAAVDQKLFDEQGLALLARAVGPKAWEKSPAESLGRLLRALNGDHKFEPLVLSSKLDRDKVNRWLIKGADPEKEARNDEGF